MENAWQLNNSEQDISVNMGDDGLIYLPFEMEEYDMDALMGDDDHMTTDQAMGGEEHNINDKGSSSNRVKRFTVEQLQQLEASFQECTHPDDEMRKELAARVGIETRQVKFWFQNRRSQSKVKSCGTENNKFRQQNVELLAKNMELQEQLKDLTCSRCRDPTAVKWQLLEENAKLKEMCRRANADLIKLMQEANNLPPSATLDDLALLTSMNPVSSNVGSSSTNNNQVTLFSYAEWAVKEFEILARTGAPLWLPTIGGGDMLNVHEYTGLRFPRLLGIRPQGFVVEATKDSALVRGTASDLLSILTDVPRWFKTFPGIVAAVRDNKVISSGIFASGNGLIQEITVDFSVESPCLPLRSMKFLRISMQTANGDFAVVDATIDCAHGVHEQEGIQDKHGSCRFLPSGCLIQDTGDGYCQVTCIVHAEYDETIVPPVFRQFFQSGLAFGARRWLASLKRHCEYNAVMHSSQVPSGGGLGAAVAISAMGRWSLLELAQRMMANFYKTTSPMATVEPGNIVTKLGGRRDTAGELLEPAVRMVLGNYFGAMNGEPSSSSSSSSSSVQVLSATTTVWLPGTPPEHVFHYLCNGQRRGEWDAFAYAGAVQELSSVATWPDLHGNVVSILCPNMTNAANNTTLLLQQASIDVSGALVVYSPVEKNMIRSVVMGGGDNTSNFVLVPSGFAILPDGHGKPDEHAAANSSSSALAGHNRSAGCLLTAAYQLQVPFNNLGHPDVPGTFESAGMRIYQAIQKIMAGVGTEIAVPA